MEMNNAQNELTCTTAEVKKRGFFKVFPLWAFIPLCIAVICAVFHIISRKGDITVRERDKERARAVSYMLSGEKPNTVQERDNQ